MKIFIQKITGMDLYYDNVSKDIVVNAEPAPKSTRCLKDMKEVLCDKECCDKTNQDKGMYYMFRNLCDPDDKKTAEEQNLRYDITVIPPAMIGREFTKTLGHIHAVVPDTKITYTEIYQVLNGHAIFLIEKKENGKIRVYYTKAKEGDIVIYPPNFSHVTINPTDEALIIANWTERNFKSDYKPIIKSKGLSYYYIKENNQGIFIKNPAVKNQEEIIELKPINPELIGLKKDEPMYCLIKTPQHLHFLIRPQDYETLFRKVIGE